MTESGRYEQFIARLISDIISTHREIDFLGSGAKCRLSGVLGQKHQIDVAFIDKSFTPPKLVLIECKLKKPKYRIGPEVVKILFFNGFDITASPKYPNEFLLIICSTSAFAAGAKRLAQGIKEFRLEHVPNALDYTFGYEKIVLAGVNTTGHFTDEALCIVTHVDGTKD
jgi:hypothetical protein